MDDFVPTLAVFFLFMFSGLATWLLLPLIVAIRLPLKGNYSRDSWGKLLSDLLALVVLCSLAAQLARFPYAGAASYGPFIPWIVALFLVRIHSRGIHRQTPRDHRRREQVD